MAFKSLVSAVSEQCQEMKQSLSLFPYFDTWDENAIAECCRLASIAEFPPDKIIFGPETGTHMVYFILDGVCLMIHSLLLNVKMSLYNESVYTLWKSSDSTSGNSEISYAGYTSFMFNQKDVVCDSGFGGEKPSDEVLSVKEGASAEEMTRGKEKSDVVAVKTEDLDVKEEETKNAEVASGKGIEGTKQENPKAEEELKIQFDPDHHVKVLKRCQSKKEQLIKIVSKEPETEKPKNVERFFVRTGFLIKGATFGLEKPSKDMFILSCTKVKCLRIPRGFLTEHNPCRVWDRIRLFNRLYLPKEDKILESIVGQRKWLKHKRERVEDIYFLKNIFNHTSESDVPVSTRLTEVLTH